MKLILHSAALLLLTTAVSAHEYWLEPETFFPGPNDKTVVRLYVGDGLVKDREERVYQPEKTEMFSLRSAGRTLDLKPSILAGAMPIYTFSAKDSGTYLLAMERNWSYIKLEPEKFDEYLREDGMEYIIAEREKLGESKKEGRERYSRFIKSLILVGDRRDDTWKKRVGMKLEITPLEDPYSKRTGDTVRFQITFDGKPLAGRTVFANNRAAETQRFTTDAKGGIIVKLTRPGLWRVRLVTMQRCPADCGEADWQSFWAAFTFGVR